jgi:DNA-binding NarL/FixJ family response regulator
MIQAPVIRLALADDQAMVRSGLGALLRDLGFEIVVEAADGGALLTKLDTSPVDVVVSDIRMPGTSGIDVVRILRERGNTTPVILLTTFDDSALMLAAVEAGAQGFLLKDASAEDLSAAIRAVAAGETLLQPVSVHGVRANWSATSAMPAATHLTEREVSILRLVAGGYSNKEIARTLFLSEGTIKNYMSDVLLKLDCRDRTHAVLKAITQRLL